MAITYDSTGKGTLVGANITFQVVVGNHSNRLLVVGAAMEDAHLADAVAPASVTYDGVAMTKIDDLLYNNGGDGTYNNVSLWYLLAPNVGTANVVVHWAGAPDAGASAGAISLYNVKQQAPEATAKDNGNDDTPTVDLNTLTDDAWIIDVVAINFSASTFTAGANQTERWEQADQQNAAGSTEAGGALGAHTMSWTASAASYWGIIAAAFAEQPAWVPVTNTVTFRQINSFDSSGIDTDIYGLTFDRKNLWVCGYNNKTISQVSRLGQVINSFSTAAVSTAFTGLCFFGNSFFAIDFTNSYIIHFSLTGSVLRTIDISGLGGTFYGLDFDGKYFWLCDTATPLIYKLDVDGNVINSFTPTYTDSKGVCFNGHRLLVTDETKRCIEIYDILGNPIGVFNFDPIDNAPRAIAFDGKYYWLVGNEHDYIYQLSL